MSSSPLQNNSKSITFFGDFRGDFVSDPLYGETVDDGWIPYFNVGANRNWNIQNLAIGAAITKDKYNLIVGCVFSGKGNTG